jgi:ElaB/YqjD/DUF883 family membrane-anchored ribosome-binding protein
MSDYSNTPSFGSADWLMSSVKKNPEGLLLLAAGCALLLRSGRANAQGSRYVSGQTQRYPGQSGYDGNDQDWRMREGMSRAADTARDYASNVGKTVSDTAENVGKTLSEKADRVGQTLSETTDRYVSAAGDYAKEARRTIVDQSGRIVEQAQSTVERIVQEQPLAVAIAGLAAGAAVAAAFPASRFERETLGPAGERLSDAVSTAGERLSDAASAAGERLMAAAEEKGLNKEGLKDVARDVAGSFERSFSDQQDQNPPKTSASGGQDQNRTKTSGTGGQDQNRTKTSAE